MSVTLKCINSQVLGSFLPFPSQTDFTFIPTLRRDKKSFHEIISSFRLAHIELAMVSLLSALFPPTPSFTEKDLPSLAGKVFIISGAASGVGFELAKMLYFAGGTVYVIARSVSRCEGAIGKITAQTTAKKVEGMLKPMVLDLADLSTVKPAVDEFLRQETRLDILVNNAAVMNTPVGSVGKQVR